MSWDNVGEVRYRRKPGHDQNPQLQRDPLAQLGVLGLVDRTHPPLTNEANHLVLVDYPTNTIRHHSSPGLSPRILS